MSVSLIAARIVTDPQVRSGQPIVRGTRIAVRDIVGWLSGGWSASAILTDFPEIAPDDILAALQFRESASAGRN